MKGISALGANQAVPKAEQSKKSSSRTGSVTFIETMSQTIRLQKIVVPNKAAAAELNFERNKMVNFDDIKWDAEEDKINAFIKRIEKFMKDSKKDS
ncbi:MAG: hypothetical protein HQ564_06695 [Candidatus Saganbacteria bacterium]|nr:hypothetical protein [Candidatus Saganbacteria bacterium]